MLIKSCTLHKNLISKFFISIKCVSSVKFDGNEIPIIRYPVGRQKDFLRAKEKRKKKGSVITVPKPGKLLISTDDRKLNMYTNEFPTKFEPPTLATQTWTSKKSPGRFFKIHPTRNNPSINYEEKEQVRFNDFGLTLALIEALQRLRVDSPTLIQKKVIPEILNNKNVMLAAETGCGKTYGYLLPIIDKILRENIQDSISTEPSAIILTPSKELSSQVVKMADNLNLPIHVTDLDNFYSKRNKNHLNTSDIVVGTPVIVLTMLRNRKLSLQNIRFAVIDECDTLLDESFSKFTCSILGRLNIKCGMSRPVLGDSEVQLILSSATFPEYAEQALVDIISLSNITAVSTGYMHRISPHVTHTFMRIRPSEKLSTVISLLSESKAQTHNKLTMIFCNKKETVYWLTKELIFHGLSAEMMHSGLRSEERASIIQQIQTGKLSILVCTDLSSRGLDTQMIHHVINYEFPNAPSDYIHRSGRVGRVGQNENGTVTSLISRKWEVPLLMQIEEAARRRERIQNVNANIKSHHNQRWNEKLEEEEESLD